MGAGEKPKRKRTGDPWSGQAEHWADSLREGRRNSPVVQTMTVVFVVMVVITAVSIVLMARSPVTGMCGMFGLFMVCIPLVIMGGFGFWWWSGARHFGPAEFDLSSYLVRRGDVLGVHYRKLARSQLTIPGYTVRLVLRETVRYTQGTDTATEHYDHIVGQIDGEGRTVSPGDVIEEDIEFDIPPAAMHCFDYPNNKRRW